ncbi:MAG: ABC transporter substrate-binding protein, partial [Candidatus Bathyarchaeota archaeon]
MSVQAQLPGIPEGVLRGDVIVFRAPAKSATADNMNPWIPGNPNIGGGGAPHYEPLWYINVTNMETVPMLAAGLPVYTDNYTVLTIPVRSGVYWQDGVEFTAEDIVWTINTHLETDGLTASGIYQTWVSEVSAPDKYTVVIELTEANPKFHLTFTNVMGMGGQLVMAKHVWEDEDPLTFLNSPPVGTGPYIVEDYDPNGFWMLWKLREDWEKSACGQVVGKPKPLYFLRQYYSPADPKQVIAISRHELDVTEVTMELWDAVREVNPYEIGFWKDFPYAWQYGICDHGIVFNCAKFPTNETDVRWALTLAVNMVDVNTLALDAKGRIATFHSMSVPYLQVHFEDILIPWIKDFELRDGYKPFDETIPQQIADYAVAQGHTLAAAPEDIYGPGWWRYDPEEAAKLLEDNGFTRDGEGNWLLPSGERWTMNFVIPAFHPMASRIG